MTEYEAHFDIPYANASSPRQALDLYLPPHSTASSPLLVFIHGASSVLRSSCRCEYSRCVYGNQ